MNAIPWKLLKLSFSFFIYKKLTPTMHGYEKDLHI